LFSTFQKGMKEQGNNSKDKVSFRNRTITSVIAIPIMIVLMWFSPTFTVLAAGWGAGAAYEFYGLLKRYKGLQPLTIFGMVWTVLFIVSPYFDKIPRPGNVQPIPLLLATAVILPLIILLWRRGKENAFANWAWTVAGILYIGWLVSYLVALRNISEGQAVDNGRGWIFVTIFCTFASDISAYLIGRAFGKHKLAPYVSPKKTWEGTVAGLAGSVVVSLVLVWVFSLPLSYVESIILGLLISGMGQLGDLVKSLFKRNVEVKDSGNVLPGHGGFLDRMDSLAFAGVTVYYFVQFVVLR
jgi:phosphatidate cytidylyltransferase